MTQHEAQPLPADVVERVVQKMEALRTCDPYDKPYPLAPGYNEAIAKCVEVVRAALPQRPVDGYPSKMIALARENGALKGALFVIADEKSMSLDWAKDIAKEALAKAPPAPSSKQGGGE